MGRIQVQTKAVTFKPTIERPRNASGYIASGAYSVSIANVDAAVDATVDGVALKIGETISFSASESNGTLGRIDYDATGSELLIISLRK